MIKISPLLVASLAFLCVLQRPAGAADDDAAYTETITKRADGIVAKVGIDDAAKSARIRDLLVQQYRDLRAVHDPRDEKIRQIKAAASADKATVDEQVKAEKDRSQSELDRLNEQFVAKLNAELTPDQVEAVKNALTYNVLNVTYDAMLDKLPQLTNEQKAYIRQQLTEAREKAMTGGSSEEKHAWFGKYKGRINNYLSQQGYDLKQAEKEWQERLKQRRATQPSN
jgi:DNA mismatch repair ATPase MutS